ncbi:beta-1,4-glucuronosyltransferase WelK [uncultured Phenylobacterium sp.]|uniref:beta-1,4-glucuronosyltransferase WelK n=1 Tax=uncultured Phenylobacterium sp. TaxID=349273 RepID=UPI0025F5CDE7|nr:glycosyltransferase [uncultured Phenylobacterium sp.]
MNSTAEVSAPVAGEAKAGLRLCLAASGGGHLRQLLDLEEVWGAHDHFFVTEDTALGRSVAEHHDVRFVPHYGWGQARLGKPWRMARQAFVNFFQSAAIMIRLRPDIVISTGAGAVFFLLLWARLLGAHIVVVESFARFERASLFGRMAAPFAHDVVVQSAQLAKRYPKAAFFDPLVVLDTEPPPKQRLTFVTVGAVLPFDRLVTSAAELKASGTIEDRVLIQTGVGGVQPAGMDVVETLPFNDVLSLLRDASIVICHGGTGSIVTALREGCHVVAMPRLQSLGEVYDDHQAEIIDAFARRGLVLEANSAEELRAAVEATRSRPRVVATTDPTGLRSFLTAVIERKLASRRVILRGGVATKRQPAG